MTDKIKTITSVGIDIGTTTTQVIFSSLQLMNRAPVTQVPRYEFIDRKIIFESPVYFTPLSDDDTIDEISLLEIIKKEYASAGFSLTEIETGAIIITGETSKAANARAALINLTESLGDFVVATAGPHLESIIAGRGAGSDVFSEKNLTRVLNIDIGGGTSNYVVFNNGRVEDTACLNVGGRLIELNNDGGIKKIHQPALTLIKELIPQFKENYSTLSRADIQLIVDKMADLIMECAQGSPSPPGTKLLMTEPLKINDEFKYISFSGGVGDCMYHPESRADNSGKYGDIGPMLAKSLLAHPYLQKLNILQPKQTIRATVIGAGAHTLSLSGSTIWLQSDRLPMRNLPVVFPVINWKEDTPELSEAILSGLKRQDLDPAVDEYIIYLSDEMPVKYKFIAQSAKELGVFFKAHTNEDIPALIMCNNDIGKVMGMELAPLILPKKLAVIDEVNLKEGDYVDIGKSYFGGEIVPLTIKSLAFPA
ncbi:MAG: ethanolamine ammonia-lyase reactivating factor EutA [Calditrichaceae bacterium]